jgi:hypothetical protein
MMSGGIREGATGSIIAESNTLAVADDASTTQVEAAETVLEEAEDDGLVVDELTL